ncbi:hypothetical protein ACIA8C_21585 [Nocardia sp. NPDC051321]|uniref:hypothetical protein n=1 Tax=Nocardia sp. NPDC051321 TaxID=3364323 RepID=UPI00379D494A
MNSKRIAESPYVRPAAYSGFPSAGRTRILPRIGYRITVLAGVTVGAILLTVTNYTSANAEPVEGCTKVVIAKPGDDVVTLDAKYHLTFDQLQKLNPGLDVSGLDLNDGMAVCVGA